MAVSSAGARQRGPSRSMVALGHHVGRRQAALAGRAAEAAARPDQGGQRLSRRARLDRWRPLMAGNNPQRRSILTALFAAPVVAAAPALASIAAPTVTESS